MVIEKRFDVTSLAAVMREVFIWRLNQIPREVMPKDKAFFVAQSDISRLREKVERVYAKQDGTDIWRIALAAYELIVEKDRPIDEVLNMGSGRLVKRAKALTEDDLQRLSWKRGMGDA